jgi:hypothetical protein
LRTVPNPPDPVDRPEDRHHPAFAEDPLAGMGGETAPTVQEGMAVQHGTDTLKWVRYTSTTNEISLDDAVGRGDGLFAYAYCEFEMPADRPCILSLGSNDGCRVWLNGLQVWDYPKGRPLSPDEDTVPVVLRKGRNHLLLKIENRGRAWGFLCRLIPLDHSEQLTGLFQLFDLDLAGTHPVLRLRFPSLLADGLLESADLTLHRSGDPDTIVWSGAMSDAERLEIPVHPDTFTKYVLRIRASLSDGTRYVDDIPFTRGERKVFTLFTKGATDYELVVGENASESERWAAQELKQWLTQISGAAFHLRTDRGRKRFQHSIILGYNEASASLLPRDSESPADDDESFCYFNTGPDILILGGRDRGTMYGVFSFLEREFGCRWYTPQATVVPTRDEYVFDYLRHGEKPGLHMREVCYFDALDPVWQARNKVNTGGDMPQPGGRYQYWNFHTFAKLMPPSEFFDDRPEYYSLNDGVRVADKERPHNGSQLCLANPEVLRIITARIKQVMRENPDHLVYSVSQNDGDDFGPCECDSCRGIKNQ